MTNSNQSRVSFASHRMNTKDSTVQPFCDQIGIKYWINYTVNVTINTIYQQLEYMNLGNTMIYLRKL